MQNATLWMYRRNENGRAAVFEAASEIFVFKRVREAIKSLRRCGSTVRSLYYTIVCFILFIQAYFCILIWRENIYGTLQSINKHYIKHVSKHYIKHVYKHFTYN